MRAYEYFRGIYRTKLGEVLKPVNMMGSIQEVAMNGDRIYVDAVFCFKGYHRSSGFIIQNILVVFAI